MLAAAHYYIANAAENRRPDLARRHYSAAIAAASAAGLDDVAVRCRLGLAVVEFEAGEQSAGLQRYEDALQVLEPTADADAYTVALPPYATMLISAGRLDDAHRILQQIERSVGDEVRITRCSPPRQGPDWNGIATAPTSLDGTPNERRR